MIIRFPLNIPFYERDLYIWEISNGVWTHQDLISGESKTRGSRVILLSDKFQDFPQWHFNYVAFEQLQNVHIPLMTVLEYEQYEAQIHTQIMPVLEQWSTLNFKRDTWTFIKAVISQRPWLQMDHIGHRRVNLEHEQLFCSEALTILLQHIGLVDARVKPQLIVPGDFAHVFQTLSHGIGKQVPLLDGWYYRPFMILDKWK
ncbi:hypothetical protein MIR68_009989 [Amoeboaphelidium protococcarum]|nr:hypothetical protein MIR68_009989 [Amoeboaphelidium protococcarum]